MSESNPTEFPVVRVTRGQEHKSIYVNSSRMGISPYDVRMVLGQVVELTEGQVNEDQVTLIMSPQHAKVFLRNLGKTIALYETNFGEIKETDGIKIRTSEEKQAEAPESTKKKGIKKVR